MAGLFPDDVTSPSINGSRYTDLHVIRAIWTHGSFPHSKILSAQKPHMKGIVLLYV